MKMSKFRVRMLDSVLMMVNCLAFYLKMNKTDFDNDIIEEVNNYLKPLRTKLMGMYPKEENPNV